MQCLFRISTRWTTTGRRWKNFTGRNISLIDCPQARILRSSLAQTARKQPERKILDGANCDRGGCSGAILGFFQFDQYVRAQKASFSVCLDPEDEKGWSSCTTVSTDAVRIDLNCQCDDPTKEVESCPAECPFGNKRYCSMVEVRRSRASGLREALLHDCV